MVNPGGDTLIALPVMENSMASKAQELAAVLEKHRGEKHLVVLHDYPDPDAISSAFAHQLISSEHGIDVDITYTGKISHSQNVALVKLLGISLTPFDENLGLDQYQGIVFIDNQGANIDGAMQDIVASGKPVLIVVDHHQPQEAMPTEFSDIRKIGSTATIYTQYIEQGLLTLQKSRKEHVAVATALTHGILTDTEGFVKADFEDFNAAAYLSQLRDANILEHIMNQARSKQVMDIIRRALGNRVVVVNVSIAGIGYLRSDDRDAIPQAAEFLVKEENVHTSIVYGIIRDDDQEILSGSLRTSKLMLDPDEFLKSTFGTNLNGKYYGGGKHMAGGFSIPIGFLAGNPSEQYSELKWQVYDAQVKARIMARIGVKQN